jgi:hypothetical protein
MSDSCQGSVPIDRDPDKVLTNHCKAEKGGDMTIKPPEYVLIVTNPDDSVTTN